MAPAGIARTNSSGVPSIRIRVQTARLGASLLLSALVAAPVVQAAPPAPVSQAPTPARLPGAGSAEPVLDPRRRAAEAASEQAFAIGKQRKPYAELIQAWEAALPLWQSTGDRMKIADVYGRLAGHYFLWGDYRKAMARGQAGLATLAQPASTEEAKVKIVLYNIVIMIANEQGDQRAKLAAGRGILALLRDRQFEIKELKPEQILIGIANTYADLGESDQVDVALRDVARLMRQYPEPNVWTQIRIQEAILYAGLGQVNRAVTTLSELYRQVNRGQQSGFREGLNHLPELLVAQMACKSRSREVESFLQAHQGQLASTKANSESSSKASKDESRPDTLRESLSTQKTDLDVQLTIETSRGRYAKVLSMLETRLKLERLMGAPEGEATTYRDIADIYISQGKFQQAMQMLLQARSIYQRLELKPQVIRTLTALGNLHRSLGDFPGSKAYYEQALRLAKEAAQVDDQSAILSALATLHKRQQRIPEARRAYHQSLAINEAAGNCGYATLGLLNIGQLQLDQGLVSQASDTANRALHLADDLFDTKYKRYFKASALDLQGQILLRQGKSQQAMAKVREAVRAGDEAQVYPHNRARFYSTLAKAHTALGQRPEAIAALRQQLAVYTSMNLDPERAQSLLAIARLQRDQGDRTAALTTINQAIAVVESIRQQVADPELRTSFFASQQDFYSFKIDLLLEMEQRQPGAGHAAEAFHTSERSRARTLLELLQEARADIRKGVDPALLEQERALRDRRTALDKRWKDAYSPGGDRSQLPQLQQDRQQLLQEGQALRQAMRSSSPRYAALTDPVPLTLGQVQQQLLDPDTLLLQYSLGAERSHLFVVSQDGLQVHSLPPAGQIEAQVRRLREAITEKERKEPQVEGSLASLSLAVLGPAAPALRGKRRLILVPDGALHLATFSALSLNGQPLLDGHELIQLPSSTALALIRQQRPARGPIPAAGRQGGAEIAILADPIFSAADDRVRGSALSTSLPGPSLPAPDVRALTLNRAAATLHRSSSTGVPAPRWDRLPWTRKEAEEIAALFPGGRVSVALDEQASLPRAVDPQLGQARYLHLATHGLFNIQEPALSGLVLTLVDRQGRQQDGFLQIGDVFNLNLNSELVVLSACETGLGDQVRGEGLVGLTRGFFYAGTPRVVVSLWKVDDQATAKFMSYFYEFLRKGKQSPSQALRSAQQKLRMQTIWTSPFYWGAFVLQGEW
jgi:CHAT domain-containing protein